MTIPRGRARSGRSTSSAGWLAPSDVLRLGVAVRAQLAQQPATSVVDLVRLTGAPEDLAARVRARWQARRAA